MNTLKALLMTFLTLFVLLGGIVTFNYSKDSLCYFHCDSIDPLRITKNVYYKAAQRVLLHPEAQQIILGSSRGEVVSPVWLSQETGLKTLNLSVEGAELGIKSALLNISLKNLALKKVIWIMDDFEFLVDVADSKFKFSNVLRQESFAELGYHELNLQNKLHQYLKLIDHVTLEASQRSMGDRALSIHDLGPGSGIDMNQCLADNFSGFTTELQLKKEIEMLFEAYQRKIFVKKFSSKFLDVFLSQIRKVSESGVEVEIFIPSYHPAFLLRFQNELPGVFAEHKVQMQKVEQELKNVTQVKVHNFYLKLPGSDSTPKFWNDGVHFNCRAFALMLSGGAE